MIFLYFTETGNCFTIFVNAKEGGGNF